MQKYKIIGLPPSHKSTKTRKFAAPAKKKASKEEESDEQSEKS